MLYVANITIMVGFISLIFSYYLLLALMFYSKKIRNNTVQSLFCIPGASAERQDDSRVKLILESKIGLLLEFNRYSSE